MEEGETVSILSRKEVRKQKLMEYLAAKGKLKLPNPRPYLREDCLVKKSAMTTLKVVEEKENKAPVDTFRHEGTKVKNVTAQTTKQPVRRAFGVTNTVVGKCSVPTGQQNAKCPPAARGPAQPKRNQNPVLKITVSSVSSKSNQSATTQLKKQPSTGMQSSARASSKAASNIRSSSNALWSLPVKTVSTRMSLGPIVKTKTGLIPAVIHPRNTDLRLTHTSATVATTTTTTTTIAHKVRPSTSSSVAASQRKTGPTAARNNPVSLTARAGIKAPDQTKSNSKPLLGKYSQPSKKSQSSSGLKSVPNSTCTVAPVKSGGRAGLSKTNKSAAELTDGSRKQKPEGGAQKNGNASKAPCGTSSRPASKSGARAVSKVTRAVAEQGGKTKTCKETESRPGQSSANAPPPQKEAKRTGAPAMPQTVPRAARTISHTGHAADARMSKVPVRAVPQTEGKKVTAAQEERMRKLREWREAKGISYKRPPMPVKLQVRRTMAAPQPFWTGMKEEDEVHSIIYAVDRSLADCVTLLGEGCPPHQVREVLSRLPALSQKFAKYWICQARLMEQEGNLDVLPMFEEAIRVVLEPVDELRTVVFEILKKKDELRASEANEEEDQIQPNQTPECSPDCSPEAGDNPLTTPKPVRALIWGERGDSAVVKYKITATPGGPPSQQREPARVNGQEVRFFTPVRRSVRIERASLRYPASLQDHDICVASYNDLMSREEQEDGEETSPAASDTPMYVYRQNEALKDKVFVQLVPDSGV